MSCLHEGVAKVTVQDQVITLNSIQPFAISRKITDMKVTMVIDIT